MVMAATNRRRRFGAALEARNVRNAITSAATSHAAPSSCSNPQRQIAADLLQNVGRVARGETDRLGFIEQNYGLRVAPSDRQNLSASDLLLISCRFSGGEMDDRNVD